MTDHLIRSQSKACTKPRCQLYRRIIGCCIKLPCFIRMAAFNGYGIYISGICGIGYFRSGNTLYHFSLQTYHKMTADFVVLRCRKIFKIIPVGYGSRSRIGRIMNGYIIYLFHRNLWSGIGIRCQKLHINKRCSFCLPLFRSAISAGIPGYFFLSGLSFTLFHAHLKKCVS